MKDACVVYIVYTVYNESRLREARPEILVYTYIYIYVFIYIR